MLLLLRLEESVELRQKRAPSTEPELVQRQKDQGAQHFDKTNQLDHIKRNSQETSWKKSTDENSHHKQDVLAGSKGLRSEATLQDLQDHESEASEPNQAIKTISSCRPNPLLGEAEK